MTNYHLEKVVAKNGGKLDFHIFGGFFMLERVYEYFFMLGGVFEYNFFSVYFVTKARCYFHDQHKIAIFFIP
jgi:hypothetical protein